MPEDRLSLGLVLEQPIGTNILVTVLTGSPDRFGRIRGRRATTARDWIKGLASRSSTPDNPVRTLSGGNQQRVVIAKWMATNPRILILDSPTVGVDIHGKDGIYADRQGPRRRGPRGHHDLRRGPGGPLPLRPHPGDAGGPPDRRGHGASDVGSRTKEVVHA